MNATGNTLFIVLIKIIHIFSAHTSFVFCLLYFRCTQSTGTRLTPLTVKWHVSVSNVYLLFFQIISTNKFKFFCSYQLLSVLIRMFCRRAMTISVVGLDFSAFCHLHVKTDGFLLQRPRFKNNEKSIRKLDCRVCFWIITIDYLLPLNE